MDIVILDLEWNGTYSRRLQGYINEIIEFGAVKCGPDLTERSTFSCFVKPQVAKHISSTIQSLTSITDENLHNGMTFMQAVSRFKRWAGDCVIMTWGTSDILTLIENCRYFSGDEHVPFLSRYCDLQVFAQDRMGLGRKEQVGLSRAAELLGLDVSGMDHHRALDDSLVTLQVLRRVYDRQAIASYIDLCDREFYRRITFKTTYVCDLHSPLVEKSHLRFPCPRCGEESRRLTKWSLKNKSFRADFRCTRCGHLFAGRLTIKQKYEGLAVNKKTFPLPDLESPRQAVAGPVGDMELTLPQGVGVLRFAGWKDLDFVNHAFTTRIGGVSEGQFASMNLGFNRGDEEDRVAENYKRFCAAAGFDPDSLVCGAQDHHINIRRVGKEQRGIGIWREKDMDSIDGLCTDDSSVTLVIYCADCVPLYFVDPEHHAIGLAHAGWRGTAAGMAKAMTERMALEFSTRPEALRVAIGPSIGKECFEVDEPVALEFLKLPQAEKFVTGPHRDKYHVDLWECNRQFLLSAGVKEEHITVGQVCTMCESDLIFSHRKTRGQRGSNCAMLALGDKKA